MQTRPYPYERLAKLTRQQIALSRAVRDLWNDEAVLEAQRALHALLGVEIRVEPGSVEIYPAAQIAGRLGHAPAHVACVLERADATLPAPWLLELAASDAQRLVDRALGGDESDALAATYASAPLDELSRGALAYVAARVLAALGGALTLRDVVALPLTESLLPIGACALWPIALWLAERRMQLRLYVPEQTRFEPRHSAAGALGEHALVERDLGPLPLTLIASAGTLIVPTSILRTLQTGDTVMLDDTQLTHAAGLLRGRLIAGLPGSGDSITCVVDDRALTIEGFTRRQEPRMSTIGRVLSPAEAPALHESPSHGDFALDAHIELQVEVARFTLTLAELQRLRPGDVLATGRRIGEHVTLRVAGQAFAEAELVDIEGELGVKLLSFADAGRR